MKFSTITLFLALAAAVHNLEEWQGYDDFASAYHRRVSMRLYDRSVFRVALIILTVLILAVVVTHCITGRMTVLCKLIVFAIFVNAVGHCGMSFYKRNLVPGTVSAIVLIIPLAITDIYLMPRTFGDTSARLLLYTAIGLAMNPVAVFLSLWSGLGAKWLFTYLRRKRANAVGDAD